MYADIITNNSSSSVRTFKVLRYLDIRMFRSTVNKEIFARVLFSRITLKGMIAEFKFRDWSIVFLHQ